MFSSAAVANPVLIDGRSGFIFSPSYTPPRHSSGNWRRLTRVANKLNLGQIPDLGRPIFSLPASVRHPRTSDANTSRIRRRSTHRRPALPFWAGCDWSAPNRRGQQPTGGCRARSILYLSFFSAKSKMSSLTFSLQFTLTISRIKLRSLAVAPQRGVADGATVVNAADPRGWQPGRCYQSETRYLVRRWRAWVPGCYDLLARVA
jgi:hypothetical protein